MVDMERRAVQHKRRNRDNACRFGFGDPVWLLAEVDDLNGVLRRVEGTGDVFLGGDAHGATGVVELNGRRHSRWVDRVETIGVRSGAWPMPATYLPQRCPVQRAQCSAPSTFWKALPE